MVVKIMHGDNLTEKAKEEVRAACLLDDAQPPP